MAKICMKYAIELPRARMADEQDWCILFDKYSVSLLGEYLGEVAQFFHLFALGSWLRDDK